MKDTIRNELLPRALFATTDTLDSTVLHNDQFAVHRYVGKNSVYIFIKLIIIFDLLTARTFNSCGYTNAYFVKICQKEEIGDFRGIKMPIKS